MRTFLSACAVVATTAVPAVAQAPAASNAWASGVGGEVRVTGPDGQRTVGLFRGVDADTLRLLVVDQEVVVPRESIVKLERRGDSLWNGFLIGAAVGLVPAVVLAGEVEAGGGNVAAAIVAGVSVYGLIGAGIDAMHTGWTTVYEATPQPASARLRHIWVAPTAGGMRAGYTVQF